MLRLRTPSGNSNFHCIISPLPPSPLATRAWHANQKDEEKVTRRVSQMFPFPGWNYWAWIDLSEMTKGACFPVHCQRLLLLGMGCKLQRCKTLCHFPLTACTAPLRLDNSIPVLCWLLSGWWTWLTPFAERSWSEHSFFLILWAVESNSGLMYEPQSEKPFSGSVCIIIIKPSGWL